MFDEQKLRHINGRYLRELPLDDLTARLEALTGREGLRGAAEISQEKISTLSDFWPLAGFFFDGPADDPAAREKTLGSPEALERLEKARAALAEVPEPWSEEALETALQSVLERVGGEAAAGLSADPRRARRNHRLTRHLRDPAGCSDATNRSAASTRPSTTCPRLPIPAEAGQRCPPPILLI